MARALQTPITRVVDLDALFAYQEDTTTMSDSKSNFGELVDGAKDKASDAVEGDLGQNRDRAGGLIDQAKGSGKEAWSNATGDESAQAEGQADQIVGDLKQGMADLKDKVSDVVKKVTG